MLIRESEKPVTHSIHVLSALFARIDRGFPMKSVEFSS